MNNLARRSPKKKEFSNWKRLSYHLWWLIVSDIYVLGNSWIDEEGDVCVVMYHVIYYMIYKQYSGNIFPFKIQKDSVINLISVSAEQH